MRRFKPNKEEIEKRLDLIGNLNYQLAGVEDSEVAEKVKEVCSNFFGIEDSAEALGYSIKTIQRRVESGQLNPIQVLGISFFTRQELLGG